MEMVANARPYAVNGTTRKNGNIPAETVTVCRFKTQAEAQLFLNLRRVAYTEYTSMSIAYKP